MNWIDILQAIISGVVVGLVVFGLDVIRAWRDRKLSDFRIAANWETAMPKVSLRNFYLRNANLAGLNLIGANLESADMRNSGLWAADLKNANLRNANLSKTELIGTDLKGCNAYSANFSRSKIKRHKFPDLDCITNFSDAILIKCNFQRSLIAEAVFCCANLQQVDFTGATVVDCDFTGANLTGSKWKYARIVENCIWKDVVIDDLDSFPPYLRETIRKQNIISKKKKNGR